MDILGANLINTTTMFSITSGTATFSLLIDNDASTQFVSSGESNTITMFQVNFLTPTVVSHVILLNQNFDEIYVYYNNDENNLIYFNCSNTAENLYINIESVTANSIEVVVGRTNPIGQEKMLGEMYLANRVLALENPNWKSYTQNLARKQIVHELQDGGVSVYNIRANFQAKLKLEFIAPAIKESLYTVFTNRLPFIVVPNPLEDSGNAITPVWDGYMFEVEWFGDWNFKPSTNINMIGYSGVMEVKQTA